MKKIYFLPNMVTAIGLAIGLFVIFKINMVVPKEGAYPLFKMVSILILLAAVLDFIDGALARLIHAETEFGFIFDTLSDATVFGVAPSVIMLKSLSLESGTWLSFLAVASAMVFSICAILRLVRFTIKTAQAKDDPKEKESQKKHFTGLPVPAAAAAALSLSLFFISPLSEKFWDPNLIVRTVFIASMMIILAYLMVSRWKFPSLKALHFPVPSFHLAFIVVLSVVFTLYGVLYFFPFVLTVGSWGYIFLSFILAIIRLIAGKKSKTLEDFEPESEDL